MKPAIHIVAILISISFAFGQGRYNGFNIKNLDTNNITIMVNNIGNLRLPNDYFGAVYNHDSLTSILVYDHGLQLTGKIDSDIILAFNQWGSTFSPGPIINKKAAMLVEPENAKKFRTYKIARNDNDSNPDYAEWPVDLGAPINSEGKPFAPGDQNIWTVYNSMHDSVYVWKYIPDLKPVPIEIQQYAYEYKSSNPGNIFNGIVFLEYTIINKGDKQIDSLTVGLWSDIDFFECNSFNNYPASDSVRQMAYCWADVDVCDFIPAVGYVQLYGPKICSPGDEAYFKGKKISDYKNLNLTAFHPIGDDAVIHDYLQPIRSLNNAWNYSNGLDKNGNNIIDTSKNAPTKFPFNGDPVVNTGWNFNEENNVGGGAGISIFSGPVTLAANDTQWVMYALVPGFGTSGRSAIVDMRERIDQLRNLNYGDIITDLGKEEEKLLPAKFMLSQNYPNPFNPATIIRYSIPVAALSSVEAHRLLHVTLTIYDILGNEIARPVDEFQKPGEYEVKFDGSDLASGVYIYKLSAGEFIQSRKMVLLK